METIINTFVPEEVIDDVREYLSFYDDLEIKIAKARQSKWGDLRYFPSEKKYVITINDNLNKYEFLFTMMHEVAHYLTMKKYGNKVKPHGKEWKKEFSNLLFKCVENHELPKDVADAFYAHAISPKASIITDRNLRNVLRKYSHDYNKKVLTLEMIGEGDYFVYHGKIFERLEQRRKLIRCRDVNKNKYYLFQPDVIVKRIPHDVQ